MDVNYDAARWWWEVFISVIVLLNFLYQWVTGRDRVTRSAIETAVKKFDQKHKVASFDISKLKDRITVVEKDMEKLPTHIDVAALYEKLNTTNRELGELSQNLKSTTSMLNTLHTHLLNKEG